MSILSFALVRDRNSIASITVLLARAVGRSTFIPISRAPRARLRVNGRPTCRPCSGSSRRMGSVAVVVVLLALESTFQEIVEGGNRDLVVVHNTGVQDGDISTSFPMSPDPCSPGSAAACSWRAYRRSSAPARTGASVDTATTSSRAARARSRPTGNSAVTALTIACSSRMALSSASNADFTARERRVWW